MGTCDEDKRCLDGQKKGDVGQFFLPGVCMGTSASCGWSERCPKGSKDAGHCDVSVQCLGQRPVRVVSEIWRFRSISFLLTWLCLDVLCELCVDCRTADDWQLLAGDWHKFDK